jgi:hypothetical protein
VSVAYWWKPRAEGEPTNVYLARILRELGAEEVAVKADAYHYDDFKCPPEVDDGMNIHHLILDLTRWCNPFDTAIREKTTVLILAAKRGEFDGTKEESKAWFESSEGQATLRNLLGGR